MTQYVYLVMRQRLGDTEFVEVVAPTIAEAARLGDGIVVHLRGEAAPPRGGQDRPPPARSAEGP